MSQFIWPAGTTTRGLITANPLTLMSTELNALSSGSGVVSSVGGSSGVFDPATNTAEATIGDLIFTAGGSFTPTGVPYIAVWFETAQDGTNYETQIGSPSTTVPAFARTPDVILQFQATAYASGNIVKAPVGSFILPNTKFKAYVQNLLGVNLSASGHTISLGPTALTAI